jgi:hypothetical protein
MAGTVRSSERDPGDAVARAKRTHRAEARRRYRSEQSIGAIEDGDSDIAPVEDRTSEPARPGATATARRGVAAAFREAFRPVDVPADLRSLPLLLRSRALWIPILLTLGTAVLYAAIRPETRPGDAIATVALFLKEYFLVPPAIGGAFITGFMAPRASWLLGIMVGLVAATTYSLLVLNGYVVFAPTPGTQTLAQDVVIAAFVISPVIGSFFAATAAWYRRFLYLTNPNRGRGRSGAPPRPDGRSRSGGANQKAGVRR